MVQLPSYCKSHEVYEPSDDSFLMMDAIATFVKDENPLLVLEVGSGTAVISKSLLLERQSYADFVIAEDISPYAAACSAKTLREGRYNESSEILHASLLSSLAKRRSTFDLIIFNPPYVPSEPLGKEAASETFEQVDRAWAGGIDGVEVVSEFLKTAAERLEERCGRVLLLLEQRNDPQKLLLSSPFAELWQVLDVMERKIPGENLFVYLLARRPITAVG